MRLGHVRQIGLEHVHRPKFAEFPVPGVPHRIADPKHEFGRHKNAEQFGIERTQHPFFPDARHLFQREVAFPEFEDQFDLPPDGVE